LCRTLKLTLVFIVVNMKIEAAVAVHGRFVAVANHSVVLLKSSLN
jgi:hypothetical protein